MRQDAAQCLDGPPRQRLPLGRHTGSLAAVLERQWWADAPVNDGLFVRRDANDEALTGFVCDVYVKKLVLPRLPGRQTWF